MSFLSHLITHSLIGATPLETLRVASTLGIIHQATLSSLDNAIREPSDRIHFAGRDAATTWQSRIEGAIESGERAARKVLCRMGKIMACEVKEFDMEAFVHHRWNARKLLSSASLITSMGIYLLGSNAVLDGNVQKQQAVTHWSYVACNSQMLTVISHFDLFYIQVCM